MTKMDAIQQFEKLYADLSGNKWGKKFKQQPGKYTRLEIDYGHVIFSFMHLSLKLTVCLLYL